MKKIICFLILLIAVIVIIGPAAQAQILVNTGTPGGLEDSANIVGQTGGYGNVKLEILVATVIKVLLSFLGIIFLILIIMAGFRWMMANGNEEQTKKSQDTIKNSIIGLVIVLMAYAVTYFVFNVLPLGAGSSMPNPR